MNAQELGKPDGRAGTRRAGQMEQKGEPRKIKGERRSRRRRRKKENEEDHDDDDDEKEARAGARKKEGVCSIAFSRTE